MMFYETIGKISEEKQYSDFVKWAKNLNGFICEKSFSYKIDYRIQSTENKLGYVVDILHIKTGKIFSLSITNSQCRYCKINFLKEPWAAANLPKVACVNCKRYNDSLLADKQEREDRLLWKKGQEHLIIDDAGIPVAYENKLPWRLFSCKEYFALCLAKYRHWECDLYYK